MSIQAGDEIPHGSSKTRRVVLATIVIALLAVVCYLETGRLWTRQPQRHLGDIQVLVGSQSVWLFAEVDDLQQRASPLASPPYTWSPSYIVAVEIDEDGIRRTRRSSAAAECTLRVLDASYFQETIYFLGDRHFRSFRWGDNGLEEMSGESKAELLSALGIGVPLDDAASKELIDAAIQRMEWRRVAKEWGAFSNIKLEQPRLRIW